MRKIFNIFFVLFVLCLAQQAFAAGGKCGVKARWELDGNGSLRIFGEGRMNDFSADGTPWHPDFVKYVEIDEGITYIGKNALSKTKISSISFPSTLVSIGERAFYKCGELAFAELPYGVETIEKMAFAECPSLALINIPSTTRTIGDRAFENCMTLSKVSIPSRLRSLGNGAFNKCASLTEFVELPDFVTIQNCSRYGIESIFVNDYLERSVLESSNVVKSITANVPQSSRQVFGIEAHTTDNYGHSDVDLNIPARPQINNSTYVVIISNENYGSMSDVPYSINDGTSFATYCQLVLGIPENNINFYKNATYGQMKGALAFLRDIDKAYDGAIDVIFYYSGHGAPDENSHEAFLIPVDAYKPVKDVCLSMEELYDRLGELKARSSKVFLDACFSGATRENKMIAQARAVAVVPKKNVLTGNTVVISASSEDQTSWQYNEKEHGLFTYYLLKKLQETKGDVSMGELADYLSEKVGQMSVTLNRKSQTPSASASSNVSRIWKSWLLR